MSHSDRSVSSDRTRVTQLNGEVLRQRRGAVLAKWPRIVEQSQECLRRITGANPSRFVGFPGMPESISRLSHHRNDEPNFLTTIGAFVYAAASVGEPRSTCEMIQLRVTEWISEAYRDDPPGSFEDVALDAAHLDAEEDVALVAVSISGRSTDTLIDARAKLREEMAAKQALLIEYNRELSRRNVT